MSKPRESIRLFENDFCEWFSHVHPITPLVLWVPFITWLIWRSFAVHHLSVFMVGGLGAAGFFVWTLCEYLLHRYVFHYKGTTKFEERMHFLIHGIHHADPQDATRLVMPPFAGVVLAILFYGIFRTFLNRAQVEPFFAFFLVGYLCYDYIHFYVHHFTPTTWLGKALKQGHMDHHYVSPNTRWGVSSPLWDFVFGTLEAEKKEHVTS